MTVVERRTCPDCGRAKSPAATRCQNCEHVSRKGVRRGGPGPDTTFATSEDSVWTISRRESIMTFARGSERRSLHCIGQGVEAQERDGRRQLQGDGWLLDCRSTPQSILVDLRRQSA